MTAFEEKFCGGEFWNLNLTWNTENPDFTPCFHKTVFAWIPSLILVLFSFNEFRLFKSSVNQKIPWNILNLSKIAFTILLMVSAITEIAFNGITDNVDNELTNIYPVDYVTNVVFLITYTW